MNITFSGIDEKTDLARLRNLLRPGIEIGILFTRNPEGRNRYPGFQWILETVRFLAPYCAIHICGSGARDVLINKDPIFDSGDNNALIKCFRSGYAKRLQVNGNVSVHDINYICTELDFISVITQHKESNAGLLVDTAPNHQLLVDGSGGRGILPDQWGRPQTNKLVGFAGGLGPETLPMALPQILSIADPNSWIDMEGSLRDSNDWFDINRMEAVLEIFNNIMNGK